MPQIRHDVGDSLMMRQMNPESLKGMASLLQQYGRNGDTMLAHINPKEAMLLDRVSGGGSMNPMTGMPEFFDGDADADPEGDSQGSVGDDPGLGSPSADPDPPGDAPSDVGAEIDMMSLGLLEGVVDPDVSLGLVDGALGQETSEETGLFSGIGSLFTKGFDALGNYVSYTLNNPISSLVNTAINLNPFGLAANALSMATSGRSIAGHGSELLGSLGLGVPSDVSPVAVGTQEAVQDLMRGEAPNLGGLFGGEEDEDVIGIIPGPLETPGYQQKPDYAQGGLASLPQISHSGLYRAMGRG
jgi:hypothetical protein